MYHVDRIIGDEVDLTGDIWCVFMPWSVAPHLQVLSFVTGSHVYFSIQGLFFSLVIVSK